MKELWGRCWRDGGSQQSFLVCVSIYKVMVQRCSVNQNNCSLFLRMTQPFDPFHVFFSSNEPAIFDFLSLRNCEASQYTVRKLCIVAYIMMVYAICIGVNVLCRNVIFVLSDTHPFFVLYDIHQTGLQA
jgi:hypothetical protein